MVMSILLPLSIPASLALTPLALALNYEYLDAEVRELSNILQVGNMVYAVGSRSPYIFIATYREDGRVWAKTINIGGNVSILSFNLENGVLNLIAYSRSHNVSRIYLAKMGLDGSIITANYYTINLRLLPITAVRMEESIYIVGASYILGYNLNYMVARVSSKGVEWVLEDIGGFGDDVLKCVGVTLGSRLFVAGDNRTSVSVMIISQTGDIVSSYVISYPNTTITVNGCLRLTESKFVLYGALGGRPLLIPVIVKPNLEIEVQSQIVGDLLGVVTAGAVRGNILAFYVTSGNQSTILVYGFSDPQLKLLSAFNITSVARGFVALSGDFTNMSLTYVGYIIGDKPGALILSFTVTIIGKVERPGVPRIPLLDLIDDPKLTLTLLVIVTALLTYIAYSKAKRRISRG